MTISDVLELVNPGSLNLEGWRELVWALFIAYGVPVAIVVTATVVIMDNRGPGGNSRKVLVAVVVGALALATALTSFTPTGRDMADTARSSERAVFNRNLSMTPTQALSELYDVTITHDDWRATGRELKLVTPDTAQSGFFATIDGVERKLTIETVGDVYRIYYLDGNDVVSLTPPGGETPLPVEEPVETPGPAPSPTDKGVFRQDLTTSTEVPVS